MPSRAADLNGLQLSVLIAANLRLQLPKPLRGSLVGRFALMQAGSQVAAGSFDGTLGVGTHHLACGACAGPACEECYAVRYDPLMQSWLIHSEGFLEGSFSAGRREGCRIRWSYAGTFSAPGDQDLPRLDMDWSFCGTLDGVLECACPAPAVGLAKRPGASR